MNQHTEDAAENLTEDRLNEMLDERFDIEALAQKVEHLDYSKELSRKLSAAFGSVNLNGRRHAKQLDGIQSVIRELIMDVELLKRALVSLGHVGVVERRRIEKELIRELFPPQQPRVDAGVKVHFPQPQPAKPRQVNCEERLHICQAACCRVLKVPLTPGEVDGNQLDWDQRNPYSLRQNKKGCVYLQNGGCKCSIYGERPTGCQTYSCEDDSRIWADFENMVLNPKLAQRLKSLDVVTNSIDRPFEKTEPSNGNTDKFSSEPVTETPERSTVPPPDFSALRELLAPLPEKPFVPPTDK